MDLIEEFNIDKTCEISDLNANQIVYIKLDEKNLVTELNNFVGMVFETGSFLFFFQPQTKSKFLLEIK